MTTAKRAGSRATGGASRATRPSPAVLRRRRVLVGLVAAAFVAFVALGPVRTWVHQRQRIAVAEQRLRELEQQADRLEQRRRALESDAKVEEIARSEFGMTRPGEQPYAVVPEGTPTTSTAP